MEYGRRQFCKQGIFLTAAGFGISHAVAGWQGALGESFAPRVGITTNTRGGWESDFIRSLDEAAQVGYHAIETFPQYVRPYFDNPEELKKILKVRGLRLVTVSNGSGMEMDLADPTRADRLIEDHLRLVEFIKRFDCDHLKINTGRRRRQGTTAEDLSHMAATLNRLGKRTAEQGVKLGVHAHLWAQFEKQHEVEAIMERTDPDYVNLVLDTGHYTMAGMDPVEMTRRYVERIIEFHFKDTPPDYRGGNKGWIPRFEETLAKPIFYELGKGGVDFPSLVEILRKNHYQGWITVELDSTLRTPKQSARISKNYLEKTLGLKV